VKTQQAGFVKFFVAVLYSDEKLLEEALEQLQDKYGEIDFRSERYEFNVTDYYVPEMGESIYRIFISFEALIHPKEIAQIKIDTNILEDTLSEDKKRKVNLDAGYMDYDKVVLVSAKYNGQKIYLDQGIWADLTLHYEKGQFNPYPWSFPDFKMGIYNDVFMEIRKKFKLQRKELF
jgi:hypothetical protein